MDEESGEVGAAIMTIVHDKDSLGVGLRLAKEFADVDKESALEIAYGWMTLLNYLIDDLEESLGDRASKKIH